MGEWREVSLGDICETVSKTFKSFQKQVVLINTSDVYDGKVTNHIYVANHELRGQFKKEFRNEDILYSEIRPKNRRFAYVNFDSRDYIASTKLMVIRSKKNIVLPDFLFQVLKSDRIIDELQSLAETRSGTFPQITFSELANLKIMLPPLPEQKAIAKTLSCLDDKIELNNKINANLEQTAQAIFKSWFVDFEPFQDGEFVESELGRIPKGWEVGKAEDFFDISIGKTPPRKEHQWFTTDKNDMIWVSISNMGNCGVYISDSSEYLTAESVEKFNVCIVPDNTVILSFKLTVGRVAITNGQMTTNEAIAHFKTDNQEIVEYLYCYLKTYNYQSLGSTSSIATAVNSKIIKAMPFIMPSKDVVLKFYDLVSPIMQQIKANQIETTTLTDIRDTLLPKLMSGEIDVSQSPSG